MLGKIHNKGIVVSVRITGIYIILGLIWIVLSDRLLLLLVSDPDAITRLQSYKGWFFVFATASIFFLFVKQQIKGIARQNKQLEELNFELSSVQNRLQLTSQVASIGFWDLNIATREVFYSPEWKAQVGFDDNLIGSNFEEWENRLHPSDKDAALNAFQSYLSNPSGILSLDFRLRHKDGNYRWILSRGAVLNNAAGNPQRVVGIHLDITDRKQMELLLSESENNYRLLFERNPYPMWVCDPLSNKFLAVNPAACAKYGYSRLEFLALSTKDITLDNNAPQCVSYLLSSKSAFDNSGFWQHKKKDGDIIVVEISTQNINYFGKMANLVLAQDFTDRISTEIELTQSEEKYRLLFDKAPYAVFIHTLETIQFANQAAVRLLGAEHLHSIVGSSMLNLFDPAEQLIVKSNLNSLLSGKDTTTSLSLKIRTLTNKELFLDLSSNVIEGGGEPQIQTIAVDRTAQRQTLLELKQSKEQFAQFMDNFPGFAFIKDSEGRHLFANQMFKYLTSIDITGLRNIDIWPADMAKQLDANDSKVLSSGQAMTFIEDINRGLDTLTFLSMKFPLVGANDQMRVGGVSIDITEQVKSNRKVKSLNIELEEVIATQQRSNELEHNSIELFMRIMDNRLKSPIRSISGYNRLLLESLTTQLTNEDRDLLQGIQQNMDFLSLLVDKLTLYSRLAFKEVHIRSVRIDSMVDAILRPLAHLLESSRATIKKNIQEHNTVEADEECLSVAVSSLVSNAIKYRKPNVPLVVEIGVEHSDTATQIYVKDNGMGIDQALLPSLFDPLKRGLNPVEESLGLGLAIAQKSVERLKGTILVESEVNLGSKFTIEL
ncbi:MAG: PAS domain S-box protein [Bacteroidales bacterium]|nr:PAS domain S-box protein [Bacteroidales bacterium]MBN2750719.1 PAS domain S-box protein [Bacteroidales bacterium]